MEWHSSFECHWVLAKESPLLFWKVIFGLVVFHCSIVLLLYMFLTKYEYFMYFLVSRFFTRFFAGSGPVHILGFAGSMTGPVPITLVWTFFLGRIYVSTKYIYIIQKSFQFTVVLPVSRLFIGWQLMAISSYLGVYYPF